MPDKPVEAAAAAAPKMTATELQAALDALTAERDVLKELLSAVTYEAGGRRRVTRNDVARLPEGYRLVAPMSLEGDDYQLSIVVPDVVPSTPVA